MKIFLIIIVVTVLLAGSALAWFLFFPTQKPVPPDLETVQDLSFEFRNELPDFPELNLTNMIVLGDYALADWSDENIGGMVVFERKNNIWDILVMDGGVLDQESLVTAGVPEDISKKLLSEPRY